MGWGIGLGGFASGLESGAKTAESISNTSELAAERKERQQYMKTEAELRTKELGLRQAQFDAEQQQRKIQLASEQRLQADNDQRRALFAQGNDAYNAAVKAGKAQPNDVYGWFAHQYAPQIEQFYLSKGDVQNAASFNKWAQDEGTQQQVRDMGKLIGTYRNSVQSGDFDSLQQGLTKFYNDLPSDVTGGAKFNKLNVARDDKGNITGVSGEFATSDGKTVTQNFGNLGEFQQYIESVVNPASLYAHTMASEAQAAKFTADVGEYAAKKKIDLGVDQQKQNLGLAGKTPTERYAEAQAVLAKNSTTGQAPTDAQVRAYLAQQDAYAAAHAPGLTGAPAAAPALVIVDTKTGKAVPANGQTPSPTPAPQPAPSSTAPPAGLTAPQSAPQPAAAVSTPSAAPAPPPDPSDITAPPPDPSDITAPPPAQPAPTTKVVPSGLGGSAVPMPWAGPNAQPEYATTASSNPFSGLGGAQVGSSNLDQINAARQASGLPPLTPDQVAEMTGQTAQAP